MRAKRLIFASAAMFVVAGVALLQRCVEPESGASARRDQRTAVSQRGQNRPGQIPPATVSGLGVPAGQPPSAAAGPPDRSPAQDHFAGIAPIAERTLPTATPHVYTRERLMRASTKYPLVRIEETVAIDPRTGAETLWGQRAMAADHVLVRLRPGQTREALVAAVVQHGFTIRRDIRAPGCFLVATDPGTLDSVSELTAAMAMATCVDIAEPDYLVHVSDTTPNDPSYGSLWGMPKIGMPAVWDMTTGTGGVVVAVFDTGTALDHPDLAGNIWQNTGEIADNGVDDDGNGYVDDVHGWDFYSDDNDPTDVQGHGTHVAGTIGAVGNNALGVAGVAWNVNIMTMKFFGYGADQQLEGFASDAMAGVYYVITQKTRGVPVRVTNHSWGGSGYSQILRDALEIAGGQGILHMAAAGNNGALNNDVEPHYPASYTLSNMVAVANTTQTDGLNSVSHYGATSVDLGAPGVSTYSTSWSGGYENKSGTSMSTPHVSGVAALMWDYLPHLSWQEVRQAILDGVDPVSSLSGKCVTGGRLNAYGAFEELTPYIDHTPLDNTTNVVADHVVEARIRPSVPILDTNKVVVLWNTTGDTNALTTNVMDHVAGDLFRAVIPAQSQGNEIFYMIRAETTAGLTATHPAGAPDSLHSFDVTYPVPIIVLGSPAEYGTVDPVYGTPTEPWGSTVTATASLYANESVSHRLRCDGWYGYGSVPWMGTSNTMSFVIHEDDGENILLWMWQEQYALAQTSLTATAANTVTWWDTGSAASTITAPALVDHGGTNYAFTHWVVDGVRFPGATDTAVNPATGIMMTGAREATAVYMLESLDSDGDGLPDWWEQFNFAHLDSASTNDPDGDGYGNAAELADLADPRDAASTPMGPTFVHTPLADPMGSLPPWEVTATVTDRVGVADVNLVWQRNGGGWTINAMTNSSGDVYTAAIPPPHTSGDTFAYRIEATDTILNASTSAVYSFRVAYPLASVTPAELAVRLRVETSTTRAVSLVNGGNAALNWELIPGWTDAVTTADAGEWTHSGTNEQWHISTKEVHSGSYAWYCGDETFNMYNHLMDARLVTPPVTLGTSPMLTFWQWAEMEYDGRPGYEDCYWDGAVVDISTNGGATFERIAPVGGYPYRITDNDDSPFPYFTPCLGGDGGWEQIVFNLEGYAGQTVQVQFRFGSDMYSTDRGWFIDDVAFTWGTDWLSVSPTSGVVAAQSAEDLPIQLDATGLQIGSYRGALPFACNDPTQPVLVVPVTLHVTGEQQGTSIALDGTNPNSFVITWKSSEGYVYSLLTKTNLQDSTNWIGIPDFTNMPGVEGTMSYTGALDSIRAKFYRVTESQP